jgi:hypothetical protein
MAISLNARMVRIGLVLLALAAAALLAFRPGYSAVIRDGAALSAALEKARGGEVLRLAPGSFGTLRLDNRVFPSAVVITSEDTKRPATIERLMLNGVSKLTFRDLEIGGPLGAGEFEYSKMAEVRQCADIRFERVFFHGSLDGNTANDGWGIYFGDCRNVAVVDSRFEELMRGAVFERSQDVALTGSRFHRMRSDGANFASVRQVLVDRNRFSSFHPVGTDHADAIQFFTVKGPPSTDITISNNQLLEGEGTGPQGILMNGARTGPYQRVRILNNLLYSSGAWHGIFVETAEDVEVRGNSTLSRQDDDKVFWIALKSVTRADVRDNVTERLIEDKNQDIKRGRNLILSDEPGMKRKIKGLNAGAQAVAGELLLDGYGYQAAPADGGVN